MSVYLVLMLSVIVSGVFCFRTTINQKATRRFCNISIIAMFVVQAFRATSVGEDTVAYLTWFQEYCNINTITSLFHPWRGIDIGYSILNIVVSRFTTSDRVLIVIVSFLIVSLHLKFLQHTSKDPFLSVMLFLGCNFFITSLVSWRQFIAMGIVFWMYPLMLEKQYKKALVIFALAFCFHDTSIFLGIVLCIALVLATNYKSSWLILLFGLALIPIADVLISKVLLLVPDYAIYFDGRITNNGNLNIGYMRLFYIFLQFFLMVLILITPKYHTPRITILSSVMACAIIVGVLAMYVPYVFRISYYFDYFMLILIPELIPKKSSYKSQIKLGIIFASLVLYVYYLSNNPGQTVPYRFCFLEGVWVQ